MIRILLLLLVAAVIFAGLYPFVPRIDVAVIEPWRSVAANVCGFGAILYAVVTLAQLGPIGREASE